MAKDIFEEATEVTETALAVTARRDLELQPIASAELVRADIESAILIARRFPRKQEEAFRQLMESCKRFSFADAAQYSFPRGGSTITGPSVVLAREAARVWGNMRHGLEIVGDDGKYRQIRGWAYDLETNIRVHAEDRFEKKIQRKQKDGTTRWIEPDERDLRELTNRRGAILVRNSILQILPSDLIEDARKMAEQTVINKVTEDPEGTKKQIIMAFSELGVTPAQLEEYLGQPLSQLTKKHSDRIAELRQIYQSIVDGNSSWGDYVGAAAKPAAPVDPERVKFNEACFELGWKPALADKVLAAHKDLPSAIKFVQRCRFAVETGTLAKEKLPDAIAKTLPGLNKTKILELAKPEEEQPKEPEPEPPAAAAPEEPEAQEVSEDEEDIWGPEPEESGDDDGFAFPK